MSPSEFDLRAALRDGEGDGLDVDRVVALGSARRAERRSRILTTAAAVVVVGALGTGGAFAFRGGNDSGGGSSGAKAANSQLDRAAASSAAGGGRALAPASRPGASTAAAPAAGGQLPVACPAQYPRTLLPTGPATKGPLFAQPVSSVVVCSYGSPARVTAPVRLVLVGVRATDLADRLEHAATTLDPVPCPSVPAAQQTALAIIGVTAAGRALPVVTTTADSAACNLQATNGIAVRWNWKPPADLLHELADLAPDPSGPATLTSPSSGIRVSPVR